MQACPFLVLLRGCSGANILVNHFTGGFLSEEHVS